MITIKMTEALSIINTVNATKFLDQSTVLPVVGLKLSRLLKKLEAESELYTTANQKLIDQYAKKDENGEVVQDEKGMIHIADIKAFQEEQLKLLNTEIEVEF